MDNKKRLLSLDALRGFDMLFIMGLTEVVIAFCGLFPGGSDWWLARTMHHASWNGCNIEDLIFPTFLFIAGISFPFSLASQEARGKSRGQIYLKILKRAVILVLLGMVYNGCLRFNPERFRICSVLMRIGLAWMFASIIYMNVGKIGRYIVSGIILVGYWLLIAFVPAPDAASFAGSDGIVPGPFTMQGNLVGYIDRLIMPGTLWRGYFDPEGLLSTLPAIVTALLGMTAGDIVRDSGPEGNGAKAALTMAIIGASLIVAGLIWGTFFPINKSLWTSSFVLLAGGIGFLLFALFYYIIDVRGCTRWVRPLEAVGKNSITVYMMQALINVWATTHFLLDGVVKLLNNTISESAGELALSAGYLTLCWLFCWFLYKKNTFLKI